MPNILHIEAVSKKCGLSRSAIYERVKNDPNFPKPLKIGPQRIGFVEAELDAWIEGLMAERALPVRRVARRDRAAA